MSTVELVIVFLVALLAGTAIITYFEPPNGDD